MKRLRMAAFAALAGLAFVPGCCCSFGNGEILNSMGLARTCPCGESSTCSTCGSAPMRVDGPMLGDPSGLYMNPAQPPPVQELQMPRLTPQAQPTPAGAMSTTKLK